MTDQQLQLIKDRTGFNFDEILDMPNEGFYFAHIGPLVSNEIITHKQFKWLTDKRNEKTKTTN